MNEKYIWNYLFREIKNPYGVAGLMGNLYAESGLRSTDLEGKYEKRLGLTDAEYTSGVDNGTYTAFVHDSAGYGLAQWTYWSRKAALLNFAVEKGVSIGDLDMQLEFLAMELQKDFKTVWNTLLSASSIREASDAVMLKYEKPANQSEENQERRAFFGQKYLRFFVEEGYGMDPQKVIGIASGEVGYLEKNNNSQLDDKTANAGINNNTKYARDLDALSWFNGKKQGFAWCAVFVTWCFYQAYGNAARAMLFQPEKDNCAAGCGSARGYFNRRGRLFNTPEPGDQIFFWSSDMSKISHTGLVIDVDNSCVYTIEGNTSNGTSIIANGGAVCQKRYDLSNKRIAGYGRPDWDTASDGGDQKGGESSMSADYSAKVYAANGKPVNLRASASTNSKVLCKVPVGEYVNVIEETNDTWARCAYEGYTGYMMRQYLLEEEPAADTSSGTVTVSCAELQEIYDRIGRILGKE